MDALRIGCAFNSDANPGEDASFAGCAGSDPDRLSLFIHARLQDGDNPPSHDVCHVIARAEGGRHNVFGVGDVIGDAASLVGGHIFNDDLIGFTVTQDADGCPLQGDNVICQGEGSTVRRQEQVRGGVGRRKRRSGGGFVWIGCAFAERYQDRLPEEYVIGGETVELFDGVHRNGVVGSNAGECVVFLNGDRHGFTGDAGRICGKRCVGGWRWDGGSGIGNLQDLPNGDRTTGRQVVGDDDALHRNVEVERDL